MCGRFTLFSPVEILKDIFNVEEVPALAPRYNIAPTQPAACIRSPAGRPGREFALLRWGLIPFWAKDMEIGSRLINARAETAAEKPSFREAFRRRRCLVLADGFYEWAKRPDGRKQPYWFHLADRRPFAFAGLWERWQANEEGPIESFTILTTEANASVRPIHDRMPVILPASHHDLWLDTAAGDRATLSSLLVPYPAEGMAAHPVGPWVNNPRTDSPRCCEPETI